MSTTNVKHLSRLRLLVTLDGSSHDRVVLGEVVRLAASAPLEVTLLHVAHYHMRDERSFERARSQAIVGQARERLQLPGIVIHTLVCDGEVGPAIVAQAGATKADLVVMAGHGHNALRRLLERSLPDWVRRHSSVPVIVLPVQRRAA